MNLYLITNELKLQFYEMRQYWFETLTGLVFICGIFIGLFYGIKGFVVGDSDGQTLDGLLFGFLLWTFASSAYGAITKSIIEDTQRGYIEQLFLCPAGIERLLLNRAFAEIVSGFIFLTIAAYLVMALTGNWLDINFFMFYGLLLIAGPSLVGLGYMVSGIALVFKKVETFGAMLTLALMGLVALDGFPLNPLTFLPFVPGASLARDVVLEHADINLVHLGIVVANSLVYLVLGLMVFKACVRAAKKKNLIGQY